MNVGPDKHELSVPTSNHCVRTLTQLANPRNDPLGSDDAGNSGETLVAQVVCKRWRRRRYLSRLCLILVILILGMLGWQLSPMPASAGTGSSGWVQQGYSLRNTTCCGGHAMDGWHSQISASVLTPSNDCLIADVVMFDWTMDRQLETGYVRCATGHYLDSQHCSENNNAIKYSETWTGGDGYTCIYNSQYTTLGNAHWFSVRRTLTNGCALYVGSFIDATEQVLLNNSADFLLENTCGHDWENVAWAEETGWNCTSSSDHFSANYTDLARVDVATGVWTSITQPDKYFYNVPAAKCSSFNRSSISNSAFTVTEN